MRSVVARVVAAYVPSWLRCLLGGHEYLRTIEPGRLRLVCAHCGKRTAGVPFAIR